MKSLLPITEERPYIIYYPSGRILSFTGLFTVGSYAGPDNGVIPCLSYGANDVLILDPRAVVTTTEDSVVYSPIWYTDNLSKDIQTWMKENPQWPPDAFRSARRPT